MDRCAKNRILSKMLLNFLALAIFILVAGLILQIVIIMRGRNHRQFSYSHPEIIDDNFVNVVTSCGFVQGLVQNQSYAFLGIPYAIPAIGSRRFRHSEVPNRLEYCWEGTYSAVERRKPCWQYFRNGSYDGAENCLFLNIYTPQLHTDSPRPVVIFFGGDTLDGGESLEIQPTAELASRRNLVFISVSIRRSALAFLSLRTISKWNSKSTGNYGLSDCLTALKWLKLNIGNFGGNPNDVTVLAQNSGSTLFTALLKNPSFKTDLFHKIWLSGGDTRDPVMLEEAYERNEKLMEQIECENYDCLFSRKTTPEVFLEIVPYDWRSFYYELPTVGEASHNWLVYDGNILQRSLIDNNEISPPENNWQIPIVAGAPMHIDGSLEMRQFLDWNITQQYQQHLVEKFGMDFAQEAFLQYYRPDANHWQQFVRMLTDSRTICPLLETSFNKFAMNRVFFYITTHKSKSSLGYLANRNSDILAILDLDTPRSYRDRKFSDNVASLFYNFVETGFINEKIEDFASQKVLRKIFMVDDRIAEVSSYDNCDLWNRFYHNNSENNTSNESVRFRPDPEVNLSIENNEEITNSTDKSINGNSQEAIEEKEIEVFEDNLPNKEVQEI